MMILKVISLVISNGKSTDTGKEARFCC